MGRKRPGAKKTTKRSGLKKSKTPTVPTSTRKKRSKTTRHLKNKTASGLSLNGKGLMLLVLVVGLALPVFYNSCEDVSFVKNPASRTKREKASTPERTRGRSNADNDNNQSNTTKPAVSIADIESPLYEGVQVELEFEASSGTAGAALKKQLCKLEGLAGAGFFDCNATYTSPALEAGAYKFIVKAQNRADAITQVEKSFSVLPLPQNPVIGTLSFESDITRTNKRSVKVTITEVQNDLNGQIGVSFFKDKSCTNPIQGSQNLPHQDTPYTLESVDVTDDNKIIICARISSSLTQYGTTHTKESACICKELIYDTKGPSLQIVAPANGAEYGATVRVGWREVNGVGDLKRTQCRGPYAKSATAPAWQDCTANKLQNFSSRIEGAYIFEAKAWDNLDNMGDVAKGEFAVKPYNPRSVPASLSFSQTYTNTLSQGQVELTITSTRSPSHMQFFSDSTCSSAMGAETAFATTSRPALVRSGDKAYVYVKLKAPSSTSGQVDYSDCLSAYLLYDVLAPTVSVEDIADKTYGERVSASFSVTDTDSGIASTKCANAILGSTPVWRDCAASPVVYNKKGKLGLGTYKFYVKATDQAGNESPAISTSYSIANPTPQDLTGSVEIAAGASFTRSTNLDVSFVAQDATRTCFYTDSTCLQGEACENFTASKRMQNLVPGTNPEGANTLNVFVKYKHLVPNTAPNTRVENTSSCVTDSIIMDTTAPVVAIQADQSVASVTQESSAEVHFLAHDAGASGIAQVLCRASKAASITSASFAECTSPFSFAHTTGGDYKFEIKATDLVGNESAVAEHNWCYGVDCGRTNKLVTANSSTELERVGLLLIVDNSGSMSEEHDAMSKKGVPSLLAAMKGLEYRVAVSTTDYYYHNSAPPFRHFVQVSNEPPFGYNCRTPMVSAKKVTALRKLLAPLLNLGVGPINIRGEVYVLDRGPNRQDISESDGNTASFLKAQRSLSGTVTCTGTSGHDNERGISSFLKLIRAYHNSKNNESTLLSQGLWFFKNLRHLAAVVLTDEPDGSRTNAQTVINTMRSILPDTSFMWNSIYSTGRYYRDLTNLTGGSFGDVADTDTYADVLEDVVEKARRIVMQVKLECQPLNYKNTATYDEENSAHRLVEVLDASDQLLSPQPKCTVGSNLKVDCKKCVADSNGALTCTDPLDTGQYKFKYQCAAS